MCSRSDKQQGVPLCPTKLRALIICAEAMHDNEDEAEAERFVDCEIGGMDRKHGCSATAMVTMMAIVGEVLNSLLDEVLLLFSSTFFENIVPGTMDRL